MNTPPILRSSSLPFESIFLADMGRSVGVFAVWLVTAKFGQYIFFNAHTSPAVIWPPTGIAIAAVLLWGYRMWLPIALAAFIAAITGPVLPPFLVVLAGMFGQTCAPVASAYALKRFGFQSFERLRDILLFIATVSLASAVTPTIIVLSQMATGSLTAPLYTSWSRSWAGRILSALILSPFIISLADKQARSLQRKELLEWGVVFTLLGILTGVLFWTVLAQSYSFLLLFAMFSVLAWIAVRLDFRAIAIAFFIITAGGMAGVLMVNPSGKSLNEELFAVELFILLLAPIFYLFSALVSERRLASRALEERNVQLEQAMQKLSSEDQAKNEFLAILAHELRNPLAPVVSSLELLKIEAEDSMRPDALNLVSTATAHVGTVVRLIDDLLDISRISRKKFKLQREHTELQSLAYRALQSVDALYKSRRHSITVHVPAESYFIEVDSLRFEQIIVNLLNNAGKYTDPGGEILLSIVSDKKKGLRVNVKDNGIGIAPSMRHKIFEPFIQVAKNGAGVGTGLGIGLSLTKRLVELHGGTIWVESEGLGKGSEFIFTLPPSVNTRLPIAAPVQKPRITMPFAEKSVSQKRRILIVDDNEDAAHGLGALLKHTGHTVSFAYNSEGTLRQMSNVAADVVLLDIGLPDTDGYAIARLLRQRYGYHALLLVALTGYGQEGDKRKARQAGFNYHLTKPVSVAEVERILMMNPHTNTRTFKT